MSKGPGVSHFLLGVILKLYGACPRTKGTGLGRSEEEEDEGQDNKDEDRSEQAERNQNIREHLAHDVLQEGV